MRKINFNQKSFSIIFVVFGIISGFVIQSYQTENIEEDFMYTYTSRKFNINELISIKSRKSKSNDKNNSNFYIQSFFDIDLKIPENLTSEELRSFNERNLNAINGSISYKFNNDIAIKLNIVNGKIIKEKAQNHINSKLNYL